MFFIDDPTAVASPPSPPAAGTEGYFTGINAATGTPATRIRAWWLNMIQQELGAILTAAGLARSKTTFNQVLTALQTLFQTGRRNGGLTHIETPGAFTFTPNAATTRIKFRMRAGGGGGGGAPGTGAGSTAGLAAGGGSGGAWVAGELVGPFTAPLTGSVGGGGGGAAPGSGTGASGGATTLVTAAGTITAPGGGGGSSFTVFSTSGVCPGGSCSTPTGAPTGATISPGAPGVYGVFISGSLISGSGGGEGAGSGVGGGSGTGSNGNNGIGPGSGGSGASTTGSSSPGYTGGNGQHGYIEFEEIT